MPNNESFVWGLIPFIRDIGRIDRTTKKDITSNGEFVTKGIDMVDVDVPAPEGSITQEEQYQIVNEEEF
jgi:hypothetical protein